MYENICPELYQKRAVRLWKEAQAVRDRQKSSGSASNAASTEGIIVSSRQRTQEQLQVPPYTDADVICAFDCLSAVRSTAKKTTPIVEPAEDVEHVFETAGPAKKHNVISLQKTGEEMETEGGGGGQDINLFEIIAQLEKEPGKKFLMEDIIKMVEKGDFPDIVIKRVREMFNCETDEEARQLCQKDKGNCLRRAKNYQKVLAQALTKEVQDVSRLLNQIGVCCMGFLWLKVAGGWDCAGELLTFSKIASLTFSIT